MMRANDWGSTSPARTLIPQENTAPSVKFGTIHANAAMLGGLLLVCMSTAAAGQTLACGFNSTTGVMCNANGRCLRMVDNSATCVCDLGV